MVKLTIEADTPRELSKVIGELGKGAERKGLTRSMKIADGGRTPSIINGVPADQR